MQVVVLIGFEPAVLQQRSGGSRSWILPAAVAAQILSAVAASAEWTFMQQPTCANTAALVGTPISINKESDGHLWLLWYSIARML